jgi:hypothetical protein
MKGQARDDFYFINRSSLSLPGPESSSFSDFTPHKSTWFHFGRSPRLQDEKSLIPGPGHYDIPGSIGVIPPYARVKTSV